MTHAGHLVFLAWLQVYTILTVAGDENENLFPPTPLTDTEDPNEFEELA